MVSYTGDLTKNGIRFFKLCHVFVLLNLLVHILETFHGCLREGVLLWSVTGLDYYINTLVKCANNL